MQRLDQLNAVANGRRTTTSRPNCRTRTDT